LVDDLWYHWVGDVGITGPDRGRGGKYLMLPPGYKGAVPHRYFVLRPATFSVWVPWRSFLVNGDPKPGVDMVKKFTKIYSLSQASNPPTPNFVNVSDKAFNTLAPADYSFWEALNQVVQEEPTDPIDPTTLVADVAQVHRGGVGKPLPAVRMGWFGQTGFSRAMREHGVASRRAGA